MEVISSTRAALWRRLAVRFLLVPSPLRAWAMSVAQVVVPTTDADRLLRVLTITSADQDVSAGAAIVATVPSGKRWRIIQLDKAASASATAILLRRTAGTAANRVIAIPSQTAAAVQNGEWLLDQGGGIALSQGGVGDTAIHVGYMYEEEDAY